MAAISKNAKISKTNPMQPVVDQLREVLIRSVGDTRQCPHCGKNFIPNDRTAAEAWNLFKTLFGSKGGHK